MGFFDPELISVVIRNLVSNALKFTPRGGVVTLHAHQTKDGDQERLVVQVSDTGAGMSSKIIENLMNKNVHFTTYGTDNEKGSGLGFQLCKEFVALNQGRIWIESKPNTGSNFYISLPVSDTRVL
jgi:two-component system sensor histidine kinase/response regulator